MTRSFPLEDGCNQLPILMLLGRMYGRIGYFLVPLFNLVLHLGV